MLAWPNLHPALLAKVIKDTSRIDAGLETSGWSGISGNGYRPPVSIRLASRTVRGSSIRPIAKATERQIASE